MKILHRSYLLCLGSEVLVKFNETNQLSDENIYIYLTNINKHQAYLKTLLYVFFLRKKGFKTIASFSVNKIFLSRG